MDGQAVGTTSTTSLESESAPSDDSDAGARPALIAFVAVEAVALPLLLWWGRHAWFIGDEWDFLSRRTGGNLGDLFRPHGDHWVTLPVLAYRLLWWIFGLRTYVPYLLLGVGLHLTVAALLRVVMRRAGVGPWIATIAATLLVFFGSGGDNIFVAFQITLVGAFVFGLVHLLLADHEGPVDRRDWIGLGAGFAGMLCSGVAIPMTLVVGVVTLVKRGWRVAALHTVPLGVVYAIWWALAPSGKSTSPGHASNVRDAVRFVAIGVQSAFARLGQVPGVGVVLAALLVVGLVVLCTGRVRAVLRGPALAPIALLGGGLVFLVLTSSTRSGRFGGVVANLTGPDLARAGRYVYMVVAMVLPALALASDALIRRWRGWAVVVVVLLLVGLPGNVRRLDRYVDAPSTAAYRRHILAAPRLPIARQLPRSVETGIGVVPGPAIGWLLDGVPSGRIPAPGRLTRNEIATETRTLALPAATEPVSGSCVRIPRRSTRVLRAGDALALGNGAVRLTVLARGGRSQPVWLTRGGVVALAGPLRIVLVPANRSAVVCLARP